VSRGHLEPDAIRIKRLQFDERNLAHLGLKSIDDVVVKEVLEGSPRFVGNLVGRAGTHKMIGPARDDRFWTIIIVQVDAASELWRPITGWPSTAKERRAYG
jgi:hypothetical protein